MENASKALIFAASIIIGVILLTFMMYIFQKFDSAASSSEKRLSQREIDDINSKFVGYDTGVHSPSDNFTVTYTRERNGKDYPVSNTYKYGKLFGVSGISGSQVSDNDYNKSLIVASQELNVVSDVVTAINDAIDVNYKNSNKYRYNSVEVQNSVEVIVDLGDYKNDFNFNLNGSNHYQYLVIEPNKDVESKYIYGFNDIPGSPGISNEKNKIERANNLTFEDDNKVKTYDMLEELRDTKVIEDSLKTYTVHKYYFFGEVIFNDFTELIETVKFTLIRDEKFDET